jgi:hypothetical protein
MLSPVKEYYDRRAPEYDEWLVITDSARRPDVPAQREDARVLNDGSRHEVFKRWLRPEELVAELGGGEVLHAGTWFVAVRRM